MAEKFIDNVRIFSLTLATLHEPDKVTYVDPILRLATDTYSTFIITVHPRHQDMGALPRQILNPDMDLRSLKLP